MRSRFAPSLRERLEARLKVALHNGGAQAATPTGHGRYCVTGRDGHAKYTVVSHTIDRFSCDCKHGQYAGTDASCWHAAAVYLRQIADASLAGVA